MKKSNRFFLGMSALLLTFGLTMTMTGCGGDPDDPGGPTLYTVAFDVNGGTGDAPASVKQTSEGGAVTIPGQGDLVRDGYVFIGWNTVADGSGTNCLPGSYIPSGDLTLYANWTNTTYKVIFDGNGKTGGTAPVDKTQVSPGAPITLPTKGDLVKDGKHFAGWNTKADGSGTNYGAGSLYIPIKETTLYAKWTDTAPAVFTVTFEANTGSGTVPDPMTQGNEGDDVILPGNTNNMTKTDKVFDGWGTTTSGGTKYAAGDRYKPTANDTLYAQWRDPVKYTVSFNLNTGTGTTPTEVTQTTEGGNVTIPDGTGLSKTGYIFGGWNTKATGDGETVPDGNYQPTKDTILYAKWIAVYKISGVIKDSSAVVAGVGVTLKKGTLANPGTVAGAEVLTDDQGEYSFIDLEPGNYTLVLAAKSSGKTMPTATAQNSDITLGTQDYTHPDIVVQ